MLRFKNRGWIWRNTGPKYQKSDTYRSFSQLDEASEKTNNLNLWYCHGSTVIWWAHALIFDAWLHLVIKSLPLPINIAFENQNQGWRAV